MKDFLQKFLSSKYSLIVLIVLIVLFYYSWDNFFKPFLIKASESELFVEEEIQEQEELGKIKNLRTGFALAFCKDAVKEEGELPDNAEFLDDKYEAWALGNRHYVIRSSVRFVDPEKGQIQKFFACKIRMIGEDESKAESWSVLGVDFHPEAEGGSEGG